MTDLESVTYERPLNEIIARVEAFDARLWGCRIAFIHDDPAFVVTLRVMMPLAEFADGARLSNSLLASATWHQHRGPEERMA